MKRRYHKDVHYICKLSGIKKIEKVYGKLKNYDVVLTDERKKHIIERRGKDARKVLDNLSKTIKEYDYVFIGNSGCIKYVKKINDIYLLVVKLSLQNSNKGNSILTGMIVDKRRINRLIARDKLIDKKHDII